MTVNDGVSPSPKGGGGAGSAPSKSATVCEHKNEHKIIHAFFAFFITPKIQ